MKKPEPKTIKVLDWNQCTNFIERKHKINTRDFLRAHTQFGEWCDSKGYGEKDPEGLSRGNSAVWFREFTLEIASGKIQERPYQDFWHWLVEAAHVVRGGFLKLHPEMSDGAALWQKKILAIYLKEFGRGPYLTDW